MPNYLAESGRLDIPDRHRNIYVLEWITTTTKKGKKKILIKVDGLTFKDLNPSQKKVHGRFNRERTKQRAGKAVIDITAGCRPYGVYNQGLKLADMNAAEMLDYEARAKVRWMWAKVLAMADAIKASRRA